MTGGQHEELLAQLGWVRELAGSLAGPGSADDVEQEVYLAALQSPPRALGEEKGLRAWIRRVARNRVRSGVRARKNRVAREWQVARSGRTATTDEDMERTEEARRLANMLFELEDPYRRTLVLRFYDGLSSVEIAEAMGASPTAVRQRVSRGLAMLRARLESTYGPEARRWLAALAPGNASESPPRSTAAPRAHRLPTGPLLTGLAAAGVLAWVLVRGSLEESPAPVAGSFELSARLQQFEIHVREPFFQSDFPVEHEVRVDAVARVVERRDEAGYTRDAEEIEVTTDSTGEWTAAGVTHSLDGFFRSLSDAASGQPRPRSDLPSVPAGETWLPIDLDGGTIGRSWDIAPAALAAALAPDRGATLRIETAEPVLDPAGAHSWRPSDWFAPERTHGSVRARLAEPGAAPRTDRVVLEAHIESDSLLTDRLGAELCQSASSDNRMMLDEARVRTVFTGTGTMDVDLETRRILSMSWSGELAIDVETHLAGDTAAIEVLSGLIGTLDARWDVAAAEPRTP